MFSANAARCKSLTLLAQAAMLALIGLASDEKFRDIYGSPHPVLAALAWQPVILRGLMVGAAAAAGYLALADRAAMVRFCTTPPGRAYAPAHFLLGLALLAGSAWAPPLYHIDPDRASGPMAFYLVSPAIWVGYLFSGYRLMMPRGFLSALPQRWNSGIVAAAALAAISGWRLYEGLAFPGSAGLTQLSITLASGFSSLVDHPIQPIGFNEVGWPIYRTGGFKVVIAPTCAGIEGLVLISGLLLLLVFLERRSLRLPAAIALVATAALTMFLVNALRIAALLYIGDHWSPEVAVNGFHVNFGLVALIVISTGFALAIRRFAGTASPSMSLPALPADHSPAAYGGGLDSRLVIPVMAMIAATLITGLAAGTFNWLYPINMLVVSATLYYLRLPGRSDAWGLTLPPVVAGLLVLIMWIALIPTDPEASGKFARALFAAPVALSTIWLVCRVIGSSIIVPIAEELAFRSFILPWTTDIFVLRMPPAAATTLALIISSLAFGMAHSHILPGVLAGIAYGLVYLQRRERYDAIVAHGITNLGLCFYAMTLGAWSYL